MITAQATKASQKVSFGYWITCSQSPLNKQWCVHSLEHRAAVKTNEEVPYVQPQPGPHKQTVEEIKPVAYCLYTMLTLQDDAIFTYTRAHLRSSFSKITLGKGRATWMATKFQSTRNSWANHFVSLNLSSPSVNWGQPGS